MELEVVTLTEFTELRTAIVCEHHCLKSTHDKSTYRVFMAVMPAKADSPISSVALLAAVASPSIDLHTIHEVQCREVEHTTSTQTNTYTAASDVDTRLSILMRRAGKRSSVGCAALSGWSCTAE